MEFVDPTDIQTEWRNRQSAERALAKARELAKKTQDENLKLKERIRELELEKTPQTDTYNTGDEDIIEL